jgi:hypothetical protein
LQSILIVFWSQTADQRTIYWAHHAWLSKTAPATYLSQITTSIWRLTELDLIILPFYLERLIDTPSDEFYLFQCELWWWRNFPLFIEIQVRCHFTSINIMRLIHIHRPPYMYICVQYELFIF